MVSKCPHCGRRLKAGDKHVGKVVVCPACKHHFKVTNVKQEETVSTHDIGNQSHATNEATVSAPKSGTCIAPADPVSDEQPMSDVEVSLTETQGNPVTVQPGRPSNRFIKRRPFVLAALVVLAACAIVTSAAMYLYPVSQGPLTVYVVPHVDDIDGSIDKNWFSFFDRLRRWHDRYSIPGCFAFFPDTMNDEEFNRIIADMYDSKNVELVLKGEDRYREKELDRMSQEEVLQALNDWKDKFVSELQNLGRSDVRPPVTYNQIMMRLTEAIRDAANKAQFKICMELGGSEHGYINMLPDFDITQYSVSLTKTGEAGPAEEFKTPDEAIQELIDFKSDYLIYINGVKVVPLQCSQQDFRQGEESAAIDEDKWKTYTSLLRKAEKDTRVCLVTARDVYELRHRGDTL